MLTTKPGSKRQGWHKDNSLIDSFSCFLAVSKKCWVHVADSFDSGTNLLIGKEDVQYTAGHMIIMRPELPHAGVSHDFLRAAGDNHRAFISIGSTCSFPDSQQWFIEKGNSYGLAPGMRKGKNFKLVDGKPYGTLNSDKLDFCLGNDTRKDSDVA